jgi:hypothetical protein
MSDFIEHLINRHLGKGEQVLPRVRARFEPDAAATYLPQDAEEDSNRTSAYAKAISVNSPAPDTPAVNSPGDYNSIKPSIPHQHQPGTAIEPEAGPVPHPIPGVIAEVESDNNKVSHHEPLIPANPAQESVPKKEGVSKEKPAAHKYARMNENRWEQDLENHPDNIVHTATKGLLQPLEQDPSLEFEKSGNPGHIVTVNTAESKPLTPANQNTGSGSRDLPAAAASLSDTYQPAPLEPVPSTGLPMNGTGQETVMVEPQFLTPALQNTGTVSEGFLQAPAWLAQRQSEWQKGLFLKDSKAETEPVINVTIGRIEVRAIKQQKPPPPRRFVPPKPKLSLDDYLEQRNRGER